jgi:thioredoxin reductase
VRGIFAAGDLAGPRYSITGGMHGGSLAAVGCHRSLLGTLEPLTGGVSSYI